MRLICFGADGSLFFVLKKIIFNRRFLIVSIWIHLLLFAIGIVLIVKGGDFFVDSASWIAEVSGIPKFIVGATIVSVATTMPEMIVSIMAAAEGKYDMAVGNAIGSVTANTGLILSIAIIFMSIAISRKKYLVKGLLLIGAIVMVWLGSLGSEPRHFSIIASIVLFAIFAVYVFENIKSAKSERSNDEKLSFTKREAVFKVVFFVLGAVMLVFGSNLLVDHGSAIATAIGIPEAIIAITMIAIGTSLPELVTTITAIVKKQSGLSAGNIIGANVIDLSLILPLSSIVSGGRLEISNQGWMLDMPACLAIVAVAIIPTLFTEKFKKWQGAVMLCMYAGYLAIAMTCFSA